MLWASSVFQGNFLGFTCKDCPTPTMRWGQALSLPMLFATGIRPVP